MAKIISPRSTSAVDSNVPVIITQATHKETKRYSKGLEQDANQKLKEFVRIYCIQPLPKMKEEEQLNGTVQLTLPT